MTVYKLLTGRDAPISNIEMLLTNTYQIAKARFEQQQNKGKRKR